MCQTEEEPEAADLLSEEIDIQEEVLPENESAFVQIDKTLTKPIESKNIKAYQQEASENYLMIQG